MNDTCNSFLPKPYIQDNQVASNDYVTLTLQWTMGVKNPGPVVTYFLHKQGYSSVPDFLTWKKHCKVKYYAGSWLITETLEGEKENVWRGIIKNIEEMEPGMRMLWKLKEEGHEDTGANL